MSTDFIDFADRLASPDTGIEPALWLPLLHLLAQGEPVGIGDLAAVSGHTVPEISAALAVVPDTEYDADGRIIGQGLTLRPTPQPTGSARPWPHPCSMKPCPRSLPPPERAHTDAPTKDPAGL
ncbi:hypothetical protein [Arthrobacter sp. A5]|uniref:hypothetical protein n=1 Tax=Arthrobacter sp. A5 TaxID=576926 RepID=UPI003DA87C14